jgi:TolA-binding protein
MLKKHLWIASVYLLAILPFQLVGQQSTVYTHPEAYLRKGVELFEKANYVAAQQHFQMAANAFGITEIQQKGEAEYFSALCAVELFNDDAEHLMRSFVNLYPDNLKVNFAYFELGKLRYREKKYKDAIYWFNQANRSALGFEKKSELLFKLGYCYFSENELEPAKRCLFEIKDTQNKYASPATYYYSHISYSEKSYATALKGFEKLKDDETFAPLVPYYISQILFLQKEFEKVVQYAPTVLETASAKRAPEIARIIGESYYRLREYEKAVPFIEKFLEATPSLTREDNYLVGFVYYRNGNVTEAVKYLERVATDDDQFSQNAYYHLADCYIKLGDKNKARQAFSMASKANFDMVIKEDALFNFAKITYELLFNPFNEAIAAFNEYITFFPNSPRVDEAYNYLVLAYMNTKNYQGALESLEKIKNRDASIKQAYQRVAFFRGIELFQNLNFNEAIQKLTLSLNYPEYNRTLSALGFYWRGESHYRNESYAQASDDYNQFILSPGAFDLIEYQIAHYNLGYTYFKLKDYDNAIVWFRKYATNNLNKPSQLLGDAYNRIGDSYFIQRKYWPSLDYYEKASLTNTIDADYAMFQRGFTFGLVERPQKKIETLELLLQQYPTSSFVDDALYELAETHMVLAQTPEATKAYTRIEKEFPGSSYYVRALVQLGLIAYNGDNNQNAMAYYKRVVEEYPNSPEAKNALVGLRNIYVDMGDVNSFFEYSAKLGSLGNVSVSEKDSISFIASEKLYMSGDCQRTIQSLTRYLTEFPKGNFVLHANYYLGDCYLQSGQVDKSLASLTQVIQQQKNPFTVQALLKVSQIYEKKGEYALAFETYDMLEDLADARPNLLDARVGKLRSAFSLNRHQDVIEAAAKVLISEKLPPEVEVEARFKRAKALLALNRTNDAFDEFARVSQRVKTPEGSESKYQMIKIMVERKDLVKAEAEVFKFAETNTPHQYWLAKSFILLSDIYAGKNDFFQAKATLQSVIDGYQNTKDGIIDEAIEKLSQLVKEEKVKQTPKRDTIKIDYTF